MPKRKFSDIKTMIEKEKRQTLTLTITRDCNLRCKYCYESFGLRGKESMNFNTAREVITHYMEADNEFEALEIQFFGGEPMLNFPLIKEVVEWFKTQTWKKRFIFFIGTNGTILTDDMKNWLIKHKEFVVPGFSIDGNRTAHNLSRSESYDLLQKNIPFFREYWPNQPAKMTICKETIPYLADSVIELEGMDLFFTANVVFEDIWGEGEEKEKLLGIYQEQLERLIDFYSKNPHLQPVGPILSSAIEGYNKPYPKIMTLDGECVRFCGAGHEMVMADVDGSVFPCHRFAPWITERPAPTQPINRQKEWKGPEKCLSCKISASCATCAGYNWQVNGDSGIRTTYHCDAFKLEFMASAKLQAIRLANLSESKLNELSAEELSREKTRLDAIFGLINEGI